MYSLGTLSKNDSVTISYTKEKIKETVSNFKTMKSAYLREKYSLKKDSRDWTLSGARNDLINHHDENNFSEILYRPFDYRWTYFTGKKGFFAYSQEKVMKHLNNQDNLALVVGRQGQVLGTKLWNVAFISKSISDQNIFTVEAARFFLVRYDNDEFYANFPMEELDKISFFDSENSLESSEDKKRRIFNVIYYTYAILYSSRYRTYFADYLDVDFPRIPYPKDAEIFQKLCKKGKELCEIHLLESQIFNELSSKLRNKDDGVATSSNKIDQYRPNVASAKEEKLSQVGTGKSDQ